MDRSCFCKVVDGITNFGWMLDRSSLRAAIFSKQQFGAIHGQDYPDLLVPPLRTTMSPDFSPAGSNGSADSDQIHQTSWLPFLGNSLKSAEWTARSTELLIN
jgi:hypothetical protein